MPEGRGCSRLRGQHGRNRPRQIHLTLANFADEVVGTLARLFAYVGALALFAILALAGLGQLPDLRDDEPADKPGWSVADRSHPAFALSRLDSSEKTASYTILRHPEGGRSDVMRWTGDGATSPWPSSRSTGKAANST